MDNKIPLVFAISGFLIIGGCTPNVRIEQSASSPSSYVTDKTPKIGDRGQATVGATIYEEHRFLSRTAIRNDKRIFEEFGLGAKILLPKGSRLLASTVDGDRAYCSKKPSYIQPVNSSPSRPTCFFDTNNDYRLDKFWVMNTVKSSIRPMTPVPFSVGERKLGDDGFKKELVFQGMDERTLRIKYREFSDNMARPAFNQDLTYTIEKLPTEVGFRNVRIKIYATKSSQIEYMVKQGF